MTLSKTIPTDLPDGLLANYQKTEDLIGENGLLKQLTKALVERALEAEMTGRLGHAKHGPVNTPPWTGFDDKIISPYARGLTVREIQSHLEEMYGAEASPTLISSVTDDAADKVKTWQPRPLEPIYLRLSARDTAHHLHHQCY